MDEYFDLIGYEGLYKITKGGDIFGCKSKKILKYCIDKDGYLVLEIRKDNKPKKIGKHRLLALQFIPNDDPINKIQVDHIDRNKSNNSLENLRWVTPSQNMRNKDRYGIVREYVRKNNQSNFFQASVHYYDQNGNQIRLRKKNNDKEKVEKWLEETKLLYPVIV